ncbi:sulfite exporter TauE/SafE family protein [Flavobacterium phycosphaerae]|uniref:sulfite exporter TauE/SafE family protein n=1 Tax=Flavobacterium phycosphaerae TaxID=2697515 RepID=UPI001389BFF1|nr:sulfite exporter TauE/SafE family protein [Flavobacterium phycosphaerae]
MDYLVYFILLALLAEVLGTVGGFGSSLFFIPIASYFLDFHSVLGVTAMFHVLSNVTKISFFHKGFDKKLIVSLGVPAVVFVILGAYLSQFIATKWLEMGLAVFLILLSLTFLIFKNIVIQPTTLNSVSGGIASGFIAGILGTGGAIRGITLAAFNLKMEVFIATSAIIDLAIDSSRTVVYGLNGYIHKDDLYLIPILLVVSIIGTFIGKKILNKISEEQFKKTVLVLILITGIITAIRVIQTI